MVDEAARSDGARTATTDAPAPPPDELLDLLRRERADFLNYKRRITQERGADRQLAQADVLRELLPLLDDLDRGLGQVPADLAEHPWVRGVALSRRQLIDALRQIGLERIGREGEPFDPALHEALFDDARPGAEQRRVSQVVRHGYRLGDRLLRPAQVVVTGAPEPTATPEPGTTPPEADDDRPPTSATGGGRDPDQRGG